MKLWLVMRSPLSSLSSVALHLSLSDVPVSLWDFVSPCSPFPCLAVVLECLFHRRPPRTQSSPPCLFVHSLSPVQKVLAMVLSWPSFAFSLFLDFLPSFVLLLLPLKLWREAREIRDQRHAHTPPFSPKTITTTTTQQQKETRTIDARREMSAGLLLFISWSEHQSILQGSIAFGILLPGGIAARPRELTLHSRRHVSALLPV
ncbi:hypothetical protein B0T10DRAFT_92068 [Thelonectria olida]|uniref:Uncharacterized protein n=1 Tax=Thelonectria olida TaxID=1576542 RepID=A0A9P9AMQ4_9HYPO|nr:hypothetical protein B0T10DRAFT_92068 [Thelonectria olida]